VVIGTDGIGSCQSKYHTITTMTSPIDIRHAFKCKYKYIYLFNCLDLDPSLIYNKMSNNIYRSVRTFSKCYSNFVEIGAPNTQIHDRSLKTVAGLS